MKLCIFFIGVLSCSYIQASSCVTDDETLKKLSLEKKDQFTIEINSTQDGTRFVNISAPKKIANRKLKGVSAYGNNRHGKVIYFFPVDTVLREKRFVSGYEISDDLVDGSYIQFSYEECGIVFTYPLVAKELSEKRE